MKILKRIIIGILVLLFLVNLAFIVVLFGAPCGNILEDIKISVSIAIGLLLLMVLINKIKIKDKNLPIE